MEQTVLIVEDEDVFAKAVQKHLQRAGFHAEVAADLAAARDSLKQATPDLLLLDMRLPDGSGLDLLSAIRGELQLAVPVLVISAYGEIEDAVSAMKLGASDYLKKPVDLDELMLNVNKVLDQDRVSHKLALSTKREKNAAESAEFLGDSAALENIRQQLERISQLTRSSETIPPTILMLGETGTGKDVLARLLHANSARQDKPFVHVDCASLPKDLIEAELFGHAKGAFTSAHVSRTGLIEAAEDGVLFMDEIGELPMDLQAKLLAVLERRTLRKVGTTQERPVAAWIIAATNRDIEALAAQGKFRSDLYYRLNVLSINMPPLRERSDDIHLLADHFCRLNAQRYGIDNIAISPAARQAMSGYPWPGNVRELKHTIERAVLICGAGAIQPQHLSLPHGAGAGEVDKLVDNPVHNSGDNPVHNPVNNPVNTGENLTLDSAEAGLIQQALARTNGNVSKAARELGITRMALRYRIKKHNLDSGE
ncbi:MAG: sigma-54-dependent transcriptional regulator [Gammaproteobacteria bacterium]